MNPKESGIIVLPTTKTEVVQGSTQAMVTEDKAVLESADVCAVKYVDY